MYTRSGPTYDQQSLHDDSDDDTVYTRRAQAPPQSTAWQFPQSRQAQAQQPTSTFGVGRGRGRGRGIQLSQPLRRPNIPGMAARGVLAHQGRSWIDNLFASVCYYPLANWATSIQLVHRAATKALHSCLFWASLVTMLHVWFQTLSSPSTLRSQVFVFAGHNFGWF